MQFVRGGCNSTKYIIYVSFSLKLKHGHWATFFLEAPESLVLKLWVVFEYKYLCQVKSKLGTYFLEAQMPGHSQSISPSKLHLGLALEPEAHSGNSAITQLQLQE